MSAWYVVFTQPQSEKRAFLHLCRQGFDTYFPRYQKQRRHARRVQEVQAPLFPRYLFVRLDLEVEKWQAINFTRGVQSLIRHDEEPAALPEGAVEEIMAREDGTGNVELLTPEFIKGHQYRIRNGPFADLVGIFEELADSKRVVMLLNLLGREIKINAPVQALAPVS